MKARVVWLILCGIWGSTWLFIKLGLADLPPLTFAGIRFLLASAILLGVILARGVRWPRQRQDWLVIAVVGLLQFTLNYGLVFWGEQRISSGLAAVLQSTFPAFGLVIAHLTGGQREGYFFYRGRVLFGVGLGESHNHQRGVVRAVWIGLLLQIQKCLADAFMLLRVTATVEQRQRAQRRHTARLRVVFDPATIGPLQFFQKRRAARDRRVHLLRRHFRSCGVDVKERPKQSKR